MRYIITEKALIDLLASAYKLEALEFGGVNNWEWYYESLKDYFDNEADTDFYKELKEEDKLLDFHEWAEYYLLRGEVSGIIRENAGTGKEA